MTDQLHLSFETYLNWFEKQKLPLQITEKTYRQINDLNEPLPDIVVSTFIKREGENEDVAEYVPVLRLPDTEEVIALVFWRAGLMRYDYFLATYNQKGELLDQQLVASTRYEDNNITRSIMRIDEEGLIFVVKGDTALNSKDYDASSSKHSYFEVLPNGSIQESLNF